MRGLLLAVAAFLVVPGALGLSCAAVSPEERIFNYSDIAFVGTVEEVKSLSGRNWQTIEITFETEEVFIGDLQSEVKITQSCWMECGELEGRYLVLAHESADGWSIGICWYPVEIDQAEPYLEILRGDLTPPEQDPENDTPPEPSPPDDPPAAPDPPEEKGLLARIWNWLIFWR